MWQAAMPSSNAVIIEAMTNERVCLPVKRKTDSANVINTAPTIAIHHQLENIGKKLARAHPKAKKRAKGNKGGWLMVKG